MRSRNIKPGFFKNYQLGRLPYEVRLMFEGLWCLADRRGRLKDEPMQIKAEIFPYDHLDEHQTSTMLDLLQTGAFISRYQTKGNRYIQIINFEKHQYPHVREQDSTIPAPGKPGASTSLAPDKPGGNPDVLNPESPILNPDMHQSGATKILEWFETTWKQYPKERRVGKKAAFRSYQRVVKTLEEAREVAAALAQYKLSKTVQDGFIKNASTFFANWEDYRDERRDQPGAISAPIERRPDPASAGLRGLAPASRIVNDLTGHATARNESKAESS